MSALVPVLAAVLAAELGGRVRALASSARPGVAAVATGLLTSAAAGGGAMLGPALTPWARLLLVAFALLAAAAGRVAGSAATRSGTVADLLAVWRSSGPFSAFAFAAWLGDPAGAASGALAGLAAAVLLPVIVPRAAGLALGVLLATAGAIAALLALRLL